MASLHVPPKRPARGGRYQQAQQRKKTITGTLRATTSAAISTTLVATTAEQLQLQRGRQQELQRHNKRQYSRKAVA
eukprot:gene15732-biopygen20211